MGLIVMLYIQ